MLPALLFLLALPAAGAELEAVDRLHVSGVSSLAKVNQGAAATERFYPQAVSGVYDGTVVGAWIIHTPIPRTSGIMFRLRVQAYAYGDSDDIDFTVVGYAYSGTNGSIDGQAGAVINYKISDKGTDKLEKFVGIDASGKVAIAFGNTTTSAYYYRAFADAWITRTGDDLSSGWSIDQTQASNFNWKDIHALEAHNFTGGEAAVSNFKYVTSLSDWRNNSGSCADQTWCDIPGRTISYPKRRDGSLLRVTYQDTLGTNGTMYAQCIWRILVDGNQAALFSSADNQSNAYTAGAFWRMDNGSHTCVVPGYARGTRTVKVQSYRYGASECLQGLNTSGTSFLSVEEVGP
jgi:hypothetical protein